MANIASLQGQIDAAVGRSGQAGKDRLLEGLFSRLFRGLVYAQIWEDPVVDMAALEIGPSDHVVCIASGGCNLMSYLTAGPASLTAVDLSPAHVALGRLKLAAARHLPDHQRFHGFFGRADLPENPRLYDTYLAPQLDAETRAYWEARPFGRRRIAMFARGFYRFGRLGDFIGATHRVARLGRVDLAGLLDCADLEAQKAFFEERVAPLFEARLLKALVARRASLFGLGIPPAQYDKLASDGGGAVLPVLRERTRKLMCDFPVAENYFLWQACRRGYGPRPEAPLPPYLQADKFDALRAHAPRARVLNRSLTDLLAEQPASSKHAYVLLDAQDWMTDAQLNALWQQITRTAAPGARVIFRTGGAADILPGRVSPALLEQWRYDAARSEAGFRADRSAIYGGFHLYERAG
ncbi:MAG: DUF3419 family protein [Amaricoccus sp.]